MELRLRHALTSALLAVVGVGLFVLVLFCVRPFFGMTVLLFGTPGMCLGFMVIWMLSCFLGRRILVKLGAGRTPSGVAALIVFFTGAGLLVAGIGAASGPARDPLAELAYAPKIVLSNVRVVAGVADCPHRCVAGDVFNAGDKTVYEVHITLQCQDDAGRTLANVGAQAPLTPAGPLAPGGRATFLLYPTAGYAGVDPRFTRVAASVSTARLENPGPINRLGRAIVMHSLAAPWLPGQKKDVWYTPEETMEYTLRLHVNARLVKSTDGRIMAIGQVENGGDLPIRAVSVACRALDGEGRVVGSGVAPIVTYHYERLDGPYEPMPPHGSRPFSAEIMLSPRDALGHGGPVILETSVQDLNLGKKN